LGKEIHDTACLTCHTTGVLNAPKYGDKESWAKSLVKGDATLVSNAINSFNNVMPPQGGHSDLSDDEVKRAVQYMLAAVRSEDVPVAKPPVPEIAPIEPKKAETAPAVVPKEDTLNIITPTDELGNVATHEEALVNQPEKVVPASAPQDEFGHVVTPREALVDQPEKVVPASAPQDEFGHVVTPREALVDQPEKVVPASAPTEAKEKRFFHIVQKGDTLFRISRRYGVSTSDLKTWNGLQVPYLLSVGQKLWVSSPTTIVPPQIF
jgi:LysM repeat protein